MIIYNPFYKLEIGLKNILFMWFSTGIKVGKFVLLVILLFCCSFCTQQAEEKVIPEKLLPILNEAGREDPFLTPKMEPNPLSLEIGQLQLKGILWDENKPLAIINSEVVTEGQKIADKKIIKIEKDGIIVQTQDGKNYSIKLHKEAGVK